MPPTTQVEEWCSPEIKGINILFLAMYIPVKGLKDLSFSFKNISRCIKAKVKVPCLQAIEA